MGGCLAGGVSQSGLLAVGAVPDLLRGRVEGHSFAAQGTPGLHCLQADEGWAVCVDPRHGLCWYQGDPLIACRRAQLVDAVQQRAPSPAVRWALEVHVRCILARGPTGRALPAARSALVAHHCTVAVSAAFGVPPTLV